MDYQKDIIYFLHHLVFYHAVEDKNLTWQQINRAKECYRRIGDMKKVSQLSDEDMSIIKDALSDEEALEMALTYSYEDSYEERREEMEVPEEILQKDNLLKYLNSLRELDKYSSTGEQQDITQI